MTNGTMIQQHAAGSGLGSTAYADVRRRLVDATATGRHHNVPSPTSVPPTVIAQTAGLAQTASVSTDTFAVIRTNIARFPSLIVALRVGVKPPPTAARRARPHTRQSERPARMSEAALVDGR